MKKKIIAAILAVSCVGFFVGSAAAGMVTCGPVRIIGVGTTSNPTFSPGMTVYVRNDDAPAATCDLTAFPKGGSKRLVFNPSTAGASYAAILTAYSMHKNIFITVNGDGAMDSAIQIVFTQLD
jgi:hypothetical protein